MWIITRFGFFSVVQKPGEKELTIRARAREDLEALKEKYVPQLGTIVEGAGTDYQFRAKLPHDVFAEAMKEIVMDIDYSNFKNTVAREQGHERADVYHKLWGVLRDIGKRA